MVRDEQIYLEGLARELGGILTGRTGPGGSSGKGKGLMVGEGSRGVIGLDEVWVIWQRARGVCESLIPVQPDRPPRTFVPSVPEIQPLTRFFCSPAVARYTHIDHTPSSEIYRAAN
jgi:hypothetical protein